MSGYLLLNQTILSRANFSSESLRSGAPPFQGGVFFLGELNISTVFVTVCLEVTVGMVETLVGVVGTAEVERLDVTFVAVIRGGVVRAKGISGTSIGGVVDTTSSEFNTFGGITVMIAGGSTPEDGLDVTDRFEDASAAALRASVLSVIKGDDDKITKTRLPPQ